MTAGEKKSPPPYVLPVFTKAEDRMAVLFQGDAGYEMGDGSVVRSAPCHYAREGGGIYI